MKISLSVCVENTYGRFADLFRPPIKAPIGAKKCGPTLRMILLPRVCNEKAAEAFMVITTRQAPIDTSILSLRRFLRTRYRENHPTPTERNPVITDRVGVSLVWHHRPTKFAWLGTKPDLLWPIQRQGRMSVKPAPREKPAIQH